MAHRGRGAERFGRHRDQPAARPLPALSAVRKDDEPPELRPALRHDRRSCSGHGTFLDRGELHQVVKFILDGGFSRMRQAELERLEGRTTAAPRAGDASEQVVQRRNLTGGQEIRRILFKRFLLHS